MRLKAVITDLDRTLLRTDKTLSPATLRALEACRQRGMRLMVATARPERSVAGFSSLPPLDALVTLNGARTVLPDRVVEHALSRSAMLRMLPKLLALPGALVSLELSCGIYANRPIPEWQATVFQHVEELPEQALVYKLLVSLDAPEPLRRIEPLLDAEAYATLAGGTLCQIMSREATKWRGIEEALRFYGLTPAEAVYFGDDNDDLEPLRRCGRGVAMANALPHVREAADALTCSNDEDGVARYLLENIL